MTDGLNDWIASSVAGFSYDDTTAVPGSRNYHWVKARDSWGSSGYSVYNTGFCN
ncbi:MAG: hypothetical protein HF978_06965 [Desulfobacteraceae bacterium]|nr:hypothetical protein [Desulfobacteraceae bacterium]MBC2755272.1 hypothetical protein [Desulfobacteraceae bacterium]